MKSLNISYNEFGDEGLVSFTNVLAGHSLNQLHANGCGISHKGAKQLADDLIPKCSITEYHLYDNPVTIEGARVVYRAALKNESCLTVKLDKEIRSGDDEIKEIISALNDRKQIKVSVISNAYYNNII